MSDEEAKPAEVVAPAPAAKGTVSQTAVGATSTGGVLLVGMWISACIQAGHIVPMDNGTSVALATAVAPLIHAIYNIISKKLGVQP